MNKINVKNFWITYTTLNISLFLILASVSFFDYSLLLGHLVGIVSFLLFLISLKIVLKLVKNSLETQDKKQYKIKKFIAILVFLLLIVFNGCIFSLFIWINVHVNSNNELYNVAFFPFNTIAMTFPYLLMSIYSIAWAVVLFIKNKRKENNG